MKLTSEALQDGQIPLRYSKDGQNISPPLAWSDLPDGTRELALVFENITPQTKEPFVQWLVYKIPPDQGGLPEGFKHKRDPKEPLDVLHGRNSLGNVGYDGPLERSTGPSVTAFGCSRWFRRSTCRPASPRTRSSRPLPVMSSSTAI